MKTKIAFVSFGIFSMVVLNAQTRTWTLQQCVDTALARNRSVKQQVLDLKSKEIAYDQARKNILPTVTGSASHSINFGRTLGDNNTYLSGTATSNYTSVGINGSILLYNGFRLRNEIKSKQADSEASKADLEKTRNAIMTNVAAGYLQVLLNKELLRVAEEQLQLTANKIGERKALVESGKKAEGEMLELYAQKAKEDLSRTQAENSLKLSILDLAQYVEIPDFQHVDVVAPDQLSEKDFVLLTADEVYNSAIGHRPEIKGAEARLKSSEYTLAVVRAGYYPSLTLSSSIGSSYYSDNSGYKYDSYGKQLSDKVSGGFSLSLSVPIFDKFTTSNNVKSAKLSIENNKIAIDNARIELRKSIQQAYYNALSASSRWESARKSVDANNESYRFANQKYESGRASLYELYQAKNNLTQAQSEEIQAKYEYFFRVKLLELLK